MTDTEVLASFQLHMLTAKMSPRTIETRLAVVGRLLRWLELRSIVPEDESLLLTACAADLEAWQQQYAALAAATIDVYTRHVQAFYRWTIRYGLLSVEPTSRLVEVKLVKALPHPIPEDDLRKVLACAPPGLRTAYVLAAFAGLRAGECVRLRSEDLSLDAVQPVALIHGKGNKERKVPLLPPVVDELRALGFPKRRGLVVVNQAGRAYSPEYLSVESCQFMKAIGVGSTLHSLRHYFATEVAILTKDVLLVRDLLGHSSLTTTQRYMASTIDGAQDRLAGLSEVAGRILANT